MVNFTDVASRQSFRLKETPTWRKRPGEGLTQTYAKMREESYRRNAGVVRDRRFKQSIGRDPDYALKIKMNKMLSDNQFLAGRTGDVDLMRGMYSKLTPKFSRSAGSLTSFQKPGSTGVIKGKLPKITLAQASNYAPAVNTLLGTEEERESTRVKVFQEQQKERQGSSEAPKHHTPIVVTAEATSHKAPSGVATAKATAVGKHIAPGGGGGSSGKNTTPLSKKTSKSLRPLGIRTEEEQEFYNANMVKLQKVSKAKKKLEMDSGGGSGSGSDKLEIDGEGGFVGKSKSKSKGKGKGKGKGKAKGKDTLYTSPVKAYNKTKT